MSPFKLKPVIFSLCTLNVQLFAGNTIQDLIDEAIQNNEPEVIIPAGTYRVDQTLRITNVDDFAIIADDVTMIQEVREQFIFLSNCSNLLIRGLTLDHDPLPFTQATITGHAPDWSWLEAQIHAGYPQDPDTTSKIEVFEAETGLLIPDVWTIYGANVEKRTADTVRVTGTSSFSGQVELGDNIVIDCPIRIPHGVELRGSTNCRFEDITLHTSTMFGFLEIGCHGTHYHEINIIPGPSPISSGATRLRSTNADGIHSKHATLGPRIENCNFVSLSDDAIAINGDYDLILETTGNTVIMAAKRDIEIQVGDTLRSFSPAGIFNFEADVEAIAATTGYAEQLNAALASSNIYQTALFNDIYALTLSESISAAPGSTICPINRKGNGFIVRNNYIRNKRARGILIKAENGLIEGNTIEYNHMGAIVLAPELSWMEGGFSRSVRIVNNRIRHCGLNPSNWNTTQAGAITVSAEGDNGFAPAGGHLNIEISGNRIDSCLGVNIVASSITGLTITDNVMTQTHRENRAHGQAVGVNPDAAVVIINCSDVTLDRNTIDNFGGETFLATTNVTAIVGENPFSPQPTTFANFQLLYDSGGLDADDDGDQIPNLYEYLLGTNPKMRGAYAPPLRLQVGSATTSLYFLSPQVGRGDVRIEVQRSSTLDPDEWITIASRDGTENWSSPATLNTSTYDSNSELEQIEIIESNAASFAQFYRLQIEQIFP